jgi:hypothetical protein
MAGLSYFVYQGAKSKLQANGLTASEADALLALPEIQQIINDYRAGKPLPSAITNLKTDGGRSLQQFRALSKSTGMSFADTVSASIFAPSLPTRNPGVSHIEPFAQGGALYQNPQAPGVARGQALQAMSPAMSPEALSPYVADQFRGGVATPTLVDSSGRMVQQALGISPQQWDAFRQGVANIESQGGTYGIMGGAGGRFAGAYQIGLVGKPQLGEAAATLGIPTPSKAEFLSDPFLQEQIFDAFTYNNHQSLMERSAEYRALSTEKKLEVLGYAHNQGAGGASQFLKTGKAGADQWGTSGTKYMSSVRSQLDSMGLRPDWSGVEPVREFPEGTQGLPALTSPESLALATVGGVTPTAANAIERVSSTPLSTATAARPLSSVSSPITPVAANLTRAIASSPIRASGFSATPTQPLGSNVAVNALGSNVGVSPLGPNATATPLSTSLPLRATTTVAKSPSIPTGTARAVAPVRMPTVQMPAVPQRPADPFEAIKATTPTLQALSALGPSQTLSSLPPGQTLQPLSPGATLQALPPSMTAKPVGPTMLGASSPAPLASSGAATPLAASSNPFSAVGAVAAGLNPAMRSPTLAQSQSPGPAPISPSGRIPTVSRPVSVYSNTNPIGRTAAGFNGPYTGAFADREFMFPGQTGWTGAGVPTSFGRAMNVGQPSFGLQAAAASASNVAAILGAQLHLALSMATYGGFNTNHRYAFRDRAHEAEGGGVYGGNTTGPLASRGGSISGGRINMATAGNLAAQRRAAIYGR